MHLERKNVFRLTALMLFLMALFTFILLQFYHLQITEGSKWAEKARRQHYFTVKEPCRRGRFYSTPLKASHPAVPQALVYDIEKFHLHADAQALSEHAKDEIASQITKLLGAGLDKRHFYRQQLKYKSRNRKLAQWLTKEERDQLLTWWLPFAKKHRLPRNALFFMADYQRSYPYGKLLGQLLHTICEQKEEGSMQALPTGGLELYFNSYLQGKNGKRRLMRSPRHSFEMGEVLAYPINGADIYLTIDHHLQAIAEEEIAKGVERTQAKQGWAVIMDPHTGEIWAIAQYPFFNPAEYKCYFNDKNLSAHTQLRAVSDSIEPGSALKPFTLCTALLANDYLKASKQPLLFDPQEKIATSNGKFPGRSKPLRDISSCNYLDFDMALQKSSNIYMAKIIERVVTRLGSPWYRQVLAEKFAFGKRTGIEYPCEAAGLLPAIGKKYANGALEWSLATPPSLSMGYNIQLNSIQLLRAYAVLANGGKLILPTFIRRIVKKNAEGQKEVLFEHKATPTTQVLDQHIVDRVVTAMKYTTKKGGTAPKAEIFGYTEAGKTSTVHKLLPSGQYGNTHRTLFIGFTPVKNTAFVLLVALDEPKVRFLAAGGTTHRGGASAAPIFRAIATRALEYLGIPPDDPYGWHPMDPRYDSQKADWAYETEQLIKKLREWNAK